MVSGKYCAFRQRVLQGFHVRSSSVCEISEIYSFSRAQEYSHASGPMELGVMGLGREGFPVLFVFLFSLGLDVP